MFIIKIHKSAFFQSGEKILYFMSMAFANAFFSPLTQYMIFLNHILLVFFNKIYTVSYTDTVSTFSEINISLGILSKFLLTQAYPYI